MGLVSTIGMVYAGVQTREADDVFNAWVSKKSASQQHIWGHVLLPVEAEMFVHKLKVLAKKDKERYALFAGLVKKKHKKLEDRDDFSNRDINSLYYELNQDIGALVDRMQARGWRSEELNALEEKMPFQKVIDKNAQFAGILSAKKKHEAYKHQLFSLAQRMFFYLFDEGWKKSAHFFSNPAQFPILRFFYSIIWQSLAGDGWKEWSPECIKALKLQAEDGKIVRYIAGGCDIRALLDAGIFNIEVIDPMLPTQPKYYVDDWQWLVEGQIGDRITFPSGMQLMRASYRENGGSFLAKDAKKQEIQIPISTITWEVRNQQGEVCGNVVFVRRFCNKEDFAYDKKYSLLISFNELSFITCADSDNWGINPAELNKKTVVYIKQLYKPVSARIMQNMHKADDREFSFIRLGSCVK